MNKIRFTIDQVIDVINKQLDELSNRYYCHHTPNCKCYICVNHFATEFSIVRLGRMVMKDEIFFECSPHILDLTIESMIKQIKSLLCNKIIIPHKLHYRVSKKNFSIQYDFFRVYEF